MSKQDDPNRLRPLIVRDVIRDILAEVAEDTCSAREDGRIWFSGMGVLGDPYNMDGKPYPSDLETAKERVSALRNSIAGSIEQALMVAINNGRLIVSLPNGG